MKLPPHPQGGVQIGVSDILQWRDCAVRMQYGMRRHAEGDPPESWSPANAYGSAIHDCLSALDDGDSVIEAGDAAMAKFKQWLEPGDLSRLYEDMEKYLARETLGVRTLLNEGEISVRLFVHPTEGQVWFRARIDRLMQSLEDPRLLMHVDYKSSKWAKSEEEVIEDIQIWSYNWSIAEWFADLYPEIEGVRIQQTYDQLRYGEMLIPQKSDEQRTEIKRWLIAAVTAMIADEAMAPTFNQFCPWCPLKMDCPVVRDELTDWATARIAALMPREPKIKKDGTPSKVLGPPQLDPARFGEYVELLPKIKRAKQVLEAFEENVGAALKEMPDSSLHELGKKKTERSRRAFSQQARRQIIERIGLPTFLMVCDLSIASVERFFKSDKPQQEEIVALAEKRPAYTVVEDL